MSETEIIEIVSVNEAKAHLRVSHSSEDHLIYDLIVAAREYVEAATGREWRYQVPPVPGTVRARLIILMLTALWYENRSPVSVDPRRRIADVPMTVGRLVNQLKDWRLPAPGDEAEA